MVLKFHEKSHDSKSHLNMYGKGTLIPNNFHFLREHPDLAMNFRQETCSMSITLENP